MLQNIDRESGIAFSDRPAPESFDQEPAVAWSLFAERLANMAHATLNGEPMVGAAAHKEAA